MTDHAAPDRADASPRRETRSRLFLKYVGLFVAVVCVALLINGLLEVWGSYREHKTALIRIQHEQAEAAATKISQFIKEIENQVGWTTQLLWSAETIEQRGSMRSVCCARFRRSPNLRRWTPAARNNSACRGWPWTCWAAVSICQTSPSSRKP